MCCTHCVDRKTVGGRQNVRDSPYISRQVGRLSCKQSLWLCQPCAERYAIIFNIHIDLHTCKFASEFIALLDNLNLTQVRFKFRFPCKCHILDLVLVLVPPKPARTPPPSSNFTVLEQLSGSGTPSPRHTILRVPPVFQIPPQHPSILYCLLTAPLLPQSTRVCLGCLPVDCSLFYNHCSSCAV